MSTWVPIAYTLPGSVRESLLQACRERLPFEACGILFGRFQDSRAEADGFALIRNAAARPASAFAFDPADWVAAAYEAERTGRQIVGIFHSHPDGTASPSPADLRGWIPDGGSYWIIAFPPSGQPGAPVISAYAAAAD